MKFKILFLTISLSLLLLSFITLANTQVLNLNVGWNAFSLSVDRTLTKGELFKNCVLADAVYHYNTSTSAYDSVSTIRPGLGYWVKLSSTCQITLDGNPLITSSIPSLYVGWNQIGALSQSTDFNSIRGDCTILKGPQRYSTAAGTYEDITILEPGQSYWVSASSNCKLGTPSKCSDGTYYGDCSLTKPKYCSSGSLINKCSQCGCPSGTCQSDGTCSVPKCSDGTTYSACSATKPLYCDNGNLISKCSSCGCSSGTCQSSGSCSIQTTCSDGTAYNACSSTKPKYCSSGLLIDKCSTCGCVSDQECNTTSQSCYSTINRNYILNYLNESFYRNLGSNVFALTWIVDSYDILGVNPPDRGSVIKFFDSKQNQTDGTWFSRTNHYVPITAQILMLYNRSGVKPAKSLDTFFSRIDTWNEVKAEVQMYDGGNYWGGIWGYVNCYIVYKGQAPPWTNEFLNEVNTNFDSWAYNSHQRTHLVGNLYSLNLPVPRVDEVVLATLNDQRSDGSWYWQSDAHTEQETVFNIGMLGLIRDKNTVDKSLIDSAISKGAEYVKKCYKTAVVSGKTHGFFTSFPESTSSDGRATALGVLALLNPQSDVWTRWVVSATPIGDLVGYWNFNECTAKDSSGYGNDGTSYGVACASGKLGNAFSFDGLNDYVDTGNNDVLNPTNSVSVSAWIYAKIIRNYPRIVSKETDITANPYALELINSTDIKFFIGNGTTETGTPDINVNILNSWVHVVGTYDGQYIKIYVNGQLKGQTAKTGLMPSRTTKVLIGNNPTNARQFNGTIDEVKIWKKALTANEVLSEYGGIAQTCSDGTTYSVCSLTKPKYCSSGSLIDKCIQCNCPTGQSCNSTTNSCYTPPITCTCGSWTNGACGGSCSSTQRQQTRICTPTGCTPSDGLGYSRCVVDSNCGTITGYDFAVIGDETKIPELENIYKMFNSLGITYKKLLPSGVVSGSLNDVNGAVSFVDNTEILTGASVVNLFSQNHLVISHGYDFANFYYPSIKNYRSKIAVPTITYLSNAREFQTNDKTEFKRQDGTLEIFSNAELSTIPNTIKIAQYNSTHTTIFHSKGLNDMSGFYVMDLKATRNKSSANHIWNIFSAVDMVKSIPIGKYSSWIANGTSWPDLTWVNNHIKNLANSNSDIANVASIGKTVLGRDINAIFIGKGSRHAIIDGCIHGNEKSGAFSAIRTAELLIEYYRSDPSWQKKLNQYNITIIPVLNPDGFVANNRTNANGKDLNRQFPPEGTTTEPEALALRNLFDKDKPTIYINHHEGGCQYPFTAIYGNYLVEPYTNFTLYAIREANKSFTSLGHWGYVNCSSGGKGDVQVSTFYAIPRGGINSMAIAYASKYINASSQILETFASGAGTSLWALEAYPNTDINHLEHYDDDENFLFYSNGFISSTITMGATLDITLDTTGLTTSSTTRIRDMKNKGKPVEVYLDDVKKAEGSGWSYSSTTLITTVTGAKNSIKLFWSNAWV